MSTKTKPINLKYTYFNHSTSTLFRWNPTYEYLQNIYLQAKKMLYPYPDNSAEVPMATLVTSSETLPTKPFHLMTTVSTLSTQEC